jgi:hypothetical protein
MLQPSWNWCSKCQGLFYAGFSPNAGICPASGGHNFGAGFYTLSYNVTAFQTAAQQEPGWSWCNRCYGLFYAPNQLVSSCPAGGQHDNSVSFASYSLIFQTPAFPGQPNWNWCRNCQGLFYGPNMSSSRCPAVTAPDGQHVNSGSGTYNLCLAAASTWPPSLPVKPTPPNSAQWAQLSNSFPNLIQDNVVITDNPTNVYNCISYSLGITNFWINPSSPLSVFQGQYLNARSLYCATNDYQPTTVPGNAFIDGWGTGNGTNMTHGDIVFPVAEALWESKLGSWYRITHGRTELTGSIYGTVLTSFVQSSTPDVHDMVSTLPQEPDLSPEELARTSERASQVAADLGRRFDAALAAWKETWMQPPLVYSSDTRDYATGPEFDALARLGDGIIPLVVGRLSDEDGFFLLPLLEILLGRDPAPKLHPLESEQSRGRRAVRAFLKSA